MHWRSGLWTPSHNCCYRRGSPTRRCFWRQPFLPANGWCDTSYTAESSWFSITRVRIQKERRDVKSAMTVSDPNTFLLVSDFIFLHLIFIPLCTWPDTLRCTEFCCCGPSSAWAACCGSRSRSSHSRPWTSCSRYGNGWSRRHCRACGRHRSGSPRVCSGGRMTTKKCVVSEMNPSVTGTEC